VVERQRPQPKHRARAHALAELKFLGAQYSTRNLVFRLRRRRAFRGRPPLRSGSFPGPRFIDIYPIETRLIKQVVLALDWERLIPGNPGPPNGRLGTKKDAQVSLTLLRTPPPRLKKRRWDRTASVGAGREEGLQSLPNENMRAAGYESGLPFVAGAIAGYWGAAP